MLEFKCLRHEKLQDAGSKTLRMTMRRLWLIHCQRYSYEDIS